MNEDSVNTAIRAQVISELTELKKRLKEKVILEGDLAKESRELYNNIIVTLHEAYGELYGWNKEKDSATKEG